MSGSRGCAVAIAGLRKQFGSQPVLQGVDLEVPTGSLTAVLGPSGSGKTTLLRLVAGFERPDAGTIAIDGEVVDDGRRHAGPGRRRVGYVPQEGSLFPHLDVRANIGFGVPRPHRRRRVDELLAMTGLVDLADRFPHQLSGGQQQRVALARALAPGPSLVLLDEPFSGLDASLRTLVRGDVTDILAEAGASAVLVTHDQDEALSMADQVAVLREGVVAQAGSPLDLYLRPADPGMAGFLGEANLLPGTIHEGCAETVLGPLRVGGAAGLGLGEGSEVLVLVRPEQVSVSAGGEGAGAAGMAGTVSRIEYHGHDSVVSVELGEGPAPRRIVARRAGAVHVAVGASVRLGVEGTVRAWRARGAVEPGRLRS